MKAREYLTPEAAARLRGCGRSAVLAAIARGELRPRSVHIGTRGVASVGLDRAEVEAWTPRARGRRPKSG